MGGAGGVQHAGAGVGDMHDDGRELKAVHEAHGGRASALDAESDHTAGAARQVFFNERGVLRGGQAGVVDPGDVRVAFEKGGDRLGVATVALHAQVQRFHAEVEQEGVHRRGGRAEVAHELGAGLDDKGGRAECVGVDGAVVGGVGLGQARELAARPPVEAAAVHDHAAERNRVPVEVFGG